MKKMRFIAWLMCLILILSDRNIATAASVLSSQPETTNVLEEGTEPGSESEAAGESDTAEEETVTEGESASEEEETAVESEVSSEDETMAESEEQSSSETMESVKENTAEIKATELTSGDFRYTVSGTSATITGYDGTDTNLVIPETLDTYTVTAIGANAFQGKSLVSVVFPKTLQSVGANAFKNCTSLESVTFTLNEEVVPTSGNADRLYDCQIGEYAFSGCTSLNTVNLSRNIHRIEGYVFDGCSSLKSLELPDQLEYMGCYMIRGTGISTLTIPSSVTSCGNDWYNGPVAGCATLREMVFEEGRTFVPAYIAASDDYTSNLSRIVLPEGISTIGYMAFYKCRGIETVELPESLETIENGAFQRNGLTAVVFPMKLRKVVSSAFAECTSLESVTFTLNEEVVPTSGNTDRLYDCQIGEYAFSGCTSLNTVNLSRNIHRIEGYVFDGCSSLKSLELPDQLEYMGCYMIRGTGISTLTIPSSVTSCGNDWYNGPVAGCATLREMVFEEGRTSVPAYIAASADYVSNLKIAIIPSSVTSIGDRAFYNCSNLTIYGIPGSYAENYAYDNGIPFEDIRNYYPNLYQNTQFPIKVVDSKTKKPLSNAVITVMGSEDISFMTDANGMAVVDIYATAGQKIKITRDGYKVKTYSEIPWSSTELNVVELESRWDIETELGKMLPSTTMGASTLKGPQISILGETFNLFETEISFNVPFFDSVTVKADYENKSVKVLLGLSDECKAKIQAADGDDTYWSESYHEVKSLVKACGGKVDTTRLWNQFSSLRGKLKTVDGTASVGVSGKATGYLEMSYVDGEWVITDSGMMATLSANASVKVPLCYIFYSEFGMSGKVDGEIELKRNTQKTYDLSGSLGAALSPSVALGANAVVADVKGGLEGTLSGRFSFPAKTMREAFFASLTGKLFVKVSSPVKFLNGEVACHFDEIELYPNFGAYVDAADLDMSIERRQFKAEGDVYEYAEPQMASLDDGRRIMVYIDDDGTKPTGNHTTLMYSVYDNGAWSEAKAVCETGRADAGPVLCSDGNKAYVAWLNISQVIDENTDAETIYRNTELWFSEFDGTAFLEPERVPDSGNTRMEFAYDICADGNTVAVVWAENSANDPFMQSGNNTVYSRLRVDGTWTAKKKAVSTFDQISSLAVNLENGQAEVWYSDSTAVYQAGSGTSSQMASGTHVKVFDGVIYYLKDGVLCSLDAGEEVSHGILCNGDYQVNNGTVYWTVQNNFNSELYMQSLTGGTPAQLTYDGGYIDAFTVGTSTGEAADLAYTVTEVHDMEGTESPYGVTYLKHADGSAAYDLVCNGIYFDADEIVPGQSMTFAVQIENASSETVNNVRLRVKGKNNVVIVNQIVLESITAGDVQEVTFAYTLPDDLANLKLTAEVYSNETEEINYDNNIFSFQFVDADLAIVSADQTTVTVTNKGYAAAENVVIEVREGGSDGTVIDTVEIGTIAPGVSVSESISIPDSCLVFANAEDEKLFTISVSGSTQEALLYDNDYLLRIEPPHVQGIRLDREALELTAGRSETLQAVLEGENAVDTGIIWCSSNTDIAAVDENGTVTGIGAGTAQISAVTADGGYTALCHVTVTEAPAVTALSFKDAAVSMKTGEQKMLELVYEPADLALSPDQCVWISSNINVATVRDGVVTAVAAGNTTIEVSVGNVSAVCVITVTDPAELPFTDVNQSAWYYTTVKEAYELGLMTGTTSTTFAPNSPMTRAMATAVLYRISGSPAIEYESIFTDVADGKYYSKCVTWAAKNKIVNGYAADNTFRPNANVTREQMAVILYNYAKFRGLDVSVQADLSSFHDVSQISSYARTAMSWAVGNKLMSGTLEGNLNPKNEATRAECAKMLLQTYKLIEGNG